MVTNDDTATESPPGDNASFTITRYGSTAGPLTVAYRLTGTATSNVDYTVSPPSPVTILAGQSSTNITIIPINDTIGEPTETITLVLAGSPNYDLYTNVNATVNLLDDGDLPAANINAFRRAAYELNTNSYGRFDIVFTSPYLLAPVTVNGSFVRDVQISGSQNGDGAVVLAAMNEGGGGLNNRMNMFYRSTNGGATWTQYASGVHVDHHATAWALSDPTHFWIGSDGGVWRSTNSGGTFTDCNNGLTTLQFYAINQSVTIPTRALGGTQDNGTYQYDNSLVWSHELGGDGFFTEVDRSDGNVEYGELYYGDHRRTLNGGASWTTINNGITQQGPWSTPTWMDYSNSNILWAGNNTRIFRTTNRGDSWSPLSTPTYTQGGVNFAQSLRHPDTMGFVSASHIYISTDHGLSWVQRTGVTTTASAKPRGRVPSANRRLPLPTITGWIISVSSSIRSSCSSERTRVTLPPMPMFLPGSCLSRASSCARSPLISWILPHLPHATLSRVVETTNLGMELMWLAYGSSVESGQ